MDFNLLIMFIFVLLTGKFIKSVAYVADYNERTKDNFTNSKQFDDVTKHH